MRKATVSRWRNAGQTVIAGLERVSGGASRVSVWLGGGVLVFLTFFIVAHASGRYLFNAPIKGFSDVIELSMIAIVFPAMVYVTYRRGNVEVTVLVSRFPRRAQQVLASIMLFIGVGISGLLAWQGWVSALETMRAGRSTISLEIPHFPFMFLAAAGFSLMCLALVVTFFHSLGKK